MKDQFRLCLLVVLSLSVIFAGAGCQAWRVLNPTSQPVRVVRLRCEYLADPMGIETASPRLSWVLESSERAQRQSGYQIIVASEPGKLSAKRADLWNTGKVDLAESVHVAYAGKRIVSGRQCFWKVRVWDKNDQPSAWSDTGTWSTGLLEASDWKAQWISFKDDSKLEASQQKMVLPPARHYRKEFAASGEIRRATAYATALGIYELHINGRRVSEQMFTPGWSDYRKRLYYNTFDVTDSLVAGGNTIGAIVADGWYSGYVGYGLLVGYGPNKCGRYMYGKTPALLVQLEIEYANGRTERVVTDMTWKVGTGPLVEADMLMGETYDARLEIPGWDRCGFDDGSWARAILAEDNGSTKAIFHDKAGSKEVELGFAAPPVIQSYLAPPIRPTETIRPVAISEPNSGTYIFNMGQNFSGVVRLRVKGAKGETIRIRHGEMLHPDGRLMTENLRKARATDFYILKGDPAGETYEPRFTYHGFQFVELTGLAGRPTLDAVTGVVIHSDTPMVSAFSCSDEMVNQLFSNVTWTQRANFFEVPTDCPQRDERLGWTGDAQIYVRTATYNADVGAFFTKWLDDLAEAQLANGAFPDYAPYPMMHGKPNRGFATAWADAGIICPYTIYKVYGDTRLIKRQYDAMSRFMAFRRKLSPGFVGVETGKGWGVWLNLGSKTPVPFVDSVYFAYSASLMSEMAAAIGRGADAAEYGRLFENIKAAFAKEYVKADGTLTIDNQTVYVLSLSVGLIADDQIPAARKKLIQLLEENDYRMTTGFLGTKPLLAVLSDAGRDDLAGRLLQSRRFPSWGYEIVNGATSIWERWNSFTKENGFGESGMNSFSHYSFGAVCQWMFQYLAGIDTRGPGYEHIVIRPRPAEPGSNPEHDAIEWVDASYDSIRGPIVSKWRRTKGKFELEVSIPANTTGTVYLPATGIEAVTESGRSLDGSAGVGPVTAVDHHLEIEIGSGCYRFVSVLE